MEIIVNAIKFKADQKLVDYVTKKTEKIAKQLPQAVKAEILFKIDKEHESGNKITNIRVVIPGNDLFVEKQRDSFEKAFDDAFDAVRRMIEKIKDSYHQ